MSAELLRRAAMALRHGVAQLPVPVQADWIQDGAEVYTAHIDDDGRKGWVAESLNMERPDDGEEVAAYITLMQPTVALALADLLDESAAVGGRRGLDAIARAVLREEP